MSQDNKTISEEKKDYATSFEYVETFCSNGDNPKGIEYLMTCMYYCYTYFKFKKYLTENECVNCEKRKNNAINITFIGWLWQYIKDWFHNKFNEVQLDLGQTEVTKRRQLSKQLDLGQTEVTKRRQLSNLKDECNKFIMPRLEQAKQTLSM